MLGGWVPSTFFFVGSRVNQNAVVKNITAADRAARRFPPSPLRIAGFAVVARRHCVLGRILRDYARD